MAGILGIFGENRGEAMTPQLQDSINMVSIDTVQVLDCGEGSMVVSSHENSPLADSRCYEDGDFAACLGGDVVGYRKIPWDAMLDPFIRDAPQEFSELAGLFAFAVFDKRKRRLSIVSDLYSFYPVYYRVAGGSVVFSTSISTFARLHEVPPVNIHWLHEWLYFSYPVRETTIFEDVHRMAPASVFSCDVRTGGVAIHRYGRSYLRAPKPHRGREATERALSVFRERLPRYYRNVDRLAHAVTAGFDTRTVLAFVAADAKDRMETYTYGIPGCGDLAGAREIAEALGFKHHEIYFDRDFLEKLPALIYETVAVSGGLENINRSYLPYVYCALTKNGTEFPVVMSGIGADALLRGHVPTPNGISYDMERAFLTGRAVVDQQLFKQMFGASFDRFYQYINDKIDRVKETYGPFDSIQTYVSYLIYEILPRYFGGENFIASNFTALRIAFCDPEIVQLVCDIDLSVFRFVRFAEEDLYRENYLQAYLIASNPELARMPMRGMPLTAFSRNNRLLYHWYNLLARGPRKVLSLVKLRRLQVLDDWSAWYRSVLRGELDTLLGRDSILAEHIEPHFIESIRERNSIHWLKLLATAEIVLRLAGNGWKRIAPSSGASERGGSL